MLDKKTEFHATKAALGDERVDKKLFYAIHASVNLRKGGHSASQANAMAYGMQFFDRTDIKHDGFWKTELKVDNDIYTKLAKYATIAWKIYSQG